MLNKAGGSIYHPKSAAVWSIKRRSMDGSLCEWLCVCVCVCVCVCACVCVCFLSLRSSIRTAYNYCKYIYCIFALFYLRVM